MQKNDEPLISVVIPAYNREKLVKACIDSVLKQTYHNIEVIVVDDGSTDRTADVVDLYEDARVKKCIRLSQNGGACHARNVGADAAIGEYIAFQDSDDTWYVNKLKKQLDFLRSGDYEMITSGMMRTEGKRTFFFPAKHYDYSRDFLSQTVEDNKVATQNILIRKDAFNRVRFDESIKRFQDWDFGIRAAEVLKVGFLDEALCESVLQSDSISSNVPGGVNYQVLYEHHQEVIDKNPKAAAFFLRGAGNGHLESNPTLAKKYYIRSLKAKFTMRSFVKMLMSMCYELREKE